MSADTNTSDDALALQVAAALLENVNNRRQPREIKERSRRDLRSVQDEQITKGKQGLPTGSDMVNSNTTTNTDNTNNNLVAVRRNGKHADPVPSSSCSTSIAGATPGGSVGALHSTVRDEEGDVAVVANKYETCIPLVSGGTPLGTPILVAGSTSGEMASRATSASSPSTTGINTASTHSILSQYMLGGARRYADAGHPQYPPVLQQQQQGGGLGEGGEEVQHLMRLVEDEKRKNRRLATAVQHLDREVSLFRNRRQIFVTVVGFKLFNKLPSDAFPATTSGSPTLVGTDEHVEFFIVVDKSIAPKYIVRHRFNHFKALHKMLETGAFRVPRPTHQQQRAPVNHVSDGDGRTTPWQGSGYYNAPPTHDSDSSDYDSSSDCSERSTSTSVSEASSAAGSYGVTMARPAPHRLLRAADMMPQLPNKDRRRPSAGVGGLFSKISKKLGSGKDKPSEKDRKAKSADEAAHKAMRRARRAERHERENGYRSHICGSTGIPEEDLPFFERRTKELEVYLRQLLSIELFADSDVMSAFLTPDHELFVDGTNPKSTRKKQVVGNADKSSQSSSRSGSEGRLTSRTQLNNFLAPPVAGPTGRISPGGDYILSSANLAILMGDPVADALSLQQQLPSSHLSLQGYGIGPRMTPSHTPISTPYMSQNLPSHQQALAIAQQHQHVGGVGAGYDNTASGPLDVQLSAQTVRKPTARADKKTMMAMLGGKGNQRFTPASVMMGHTTSANSNNNNNNHNTQSATVNGKEPTSPNAVAPTATRPPTSRVDCEQTTKQLAPPAALALSQPSPNPQCYLTRPSPSPVPGNTRPVSPFSAVFGNGYGYSTASASHDQQKSPQANPNVAAFRNLVIASDESCGFPCALGVDAIADLREHRQREKGAVSGNGVTRTASSKSQNGGADASLHPLAPRNISRNGNFLLLLSALGFNYVPVYSAASRASGAAAGPTYLSMTLETNPLYSGSIPSNRSMNSKVSIVTPFRMASGARNGGAGPANEGRAHDAPLAASGQGHLGAAISNRNVGGGTTHSGRNVVDDDNTDDGSSSGLPSSGLPSDMSIK